MSLPATVYPDGRVCISILHAPGDDPMGYESSAERWSPVQSVEKILLSVVSMLAGGSPVHVFLLFCFYTNHLCSLCLMCFVLWAKWIFSRECFACMEHFFCKLLCSIYSSLWLAEPNDESGANVDASVSITKSTQQFNWVCLFNNGHLAWTPIFCFLSNKGYAQTNEVLPFGAKESFFGFPTRTGIIRKPKQCTWTYAVHMIYDSHFLLSLCWTWGTCGIGDTSFVLHTVVLALTSTFSSFYFFFSRKCGEKIVTSSMK